MTGCAEAVVRPNGKLYRPRKPPAVESFCDWYDDWEGAVVIRTHDIPLALELAADRIAELDLKPELACINWWRLVPWSATNEFDTNWIVDEVRGVPCVVIPYE